MDWGMNIAEKRTSNSQAFLDFFTLAAKFSSFSRLLYSGWKEYWMGWGMDLAKKKMSNSQDFLIFCTLVANGIR
jgi:hypothetical protein